MRNDDRGAGRQNISQTVEHFIHTEMVPTDAIDFLPQIICGVFFSGFGNKMIKTEVKSLLPDTEIILKKCILASFVLIFQFILT